MGYNIEPREKMMLLALFVFVSYCVLVAAGFLWLKDSGKINYQKPTEPIVTIQK